VFNKVLKSPKGGEVADKGVVGVNNPASEAVNKQMSIDF